MQSKRRRRLTAAVLGSVGNDTGAHLRATSFIGAVADTVAEIDVGAVADDVSRFAAKLALGNLQHVGDAGLLTVSLVVDMRIESRRPATYTALGKIGQALGHGSASNGEDSEGGLHLCRGEKIRARSWLEELA